MIRKVTFGKNTIHLIPKKRFNFFFDKTPLSQEEIINYTLKDINKKKYKNYYMPLYIYFLNWKLSLKKKHIYKHTNDD